MASARKRRPAERAIGAGRRDREVTIEQLIEPEGGGFPVETWTELAGCVWMHFVSSTGDELFRAAQFSAKADSHWEMEYRDDMDPELLDVPKARRLTYQGRVYDITAARLIGRREGIELDVQSKVG